MLKTKCWLGGKRWDHAMSTEQTKINSKVAEILNPWIQIHFSVQKQKAKNKTKTHTQKLLLQRNHHIAIFSTSW